MFISKTGLTTLRNKLLRDKTNYLDICLSIENSIVNNYAGIYSAHTIKEKTLKEVINENLKNPSKNNYRNGVFKESI